MKISKIKISKFHQFEDFELELTYPKGHEKAGKPLDKVCFIGQSGTGKTTLLEMICHALGIFSFSKFKKNALSVNSANEPNDFANFYLHNQIDSEDVVLYVDYGGVGKNKRLEGPIVNSILYFSTGLSQADFSTLKIDFYKDPLPKKSKRNFEVTREDVLFYPINSESLQEVWSEFYDFIKEYQHDEASFRISLTHRYESEKIDIVKELENWKKQHPNPIELAAIECLNPILKHFYLVVKTKIDDVRALDTLQISTLSDDKTIPYEHLSTGTKQIIFTAFPIYQLLEDDSIVLMDEPETSLYPDIQREIIPYYTSFDKNKTSQFFFATHSPIIASAFEPWEIVELKFDEKGKVYRDKYYEGENHVDNYRLDPQILRYDQILTRIFDLQGDSDPKRAEKLQELAILKKKVEKLKKEEMEKPSAETQKIIIEYLQLSDDISGTWAISRHEKN